MVVAVDLGGTLTKIAYAERSGVLTHLARVPTHLSEGADGVVDWLADQVTTFASAPAIGRCLGFGVAVPGVIDAHAGVVRSAPNVGWVDVALGERLTSRTGLTGSVAHDVRAGGLAEWRLGGGRDCANFLFLPLGTGIAGAMIVDGHMLEADGYAGELGHLVVAAGAGVPCPCGLVGCLETVASAAGVTRSYLRLSSRSDTVDAQRVAELARAGDPYALAAFDLLIAGLAEAMIIYATLLAPQRIVIGGGLAAAADLFLPQVQTAVRQGLTFHRVPEFTTATLGADAGVIGAGLLGWARVVSELASVDETQIG